MLYVDTGTQLVYDVLAHERSTMSCHLSAIGFEDVRDYFLKLLPENGEFTVEK